VILVLFVFLGSANALDYDKVDKYARSVRKTGDYKQLAVKLTKPFAKKENKVRAIFIWITDNMKYDYRKFKSNQKSGGYRIKGRSKKEIAIKRKRIKEKRLKSAYNKGKGVCEDYANLFVSMCRSVGIEARYITGSTRTNSRQIGKFPKYSSHAWNAVKLNNKWFLLDATWAAGSVNHNTGRFKKNYQDGYYLTNPKYFILNHYPDDKKWQLLERPVSKKEFSNFSFPHAEFFKDKNILDFFPKNGYLSAKKKYSIVKLKYSGEIPNIVMFKRGKMIKLDYNILNNEIAIKIPTKAKYHSSVILGIKNARRFDPLLEYKIK